MACERGMLDGNRYTEFTRAEDNPFGFIAQLMSILIGIGNLNIPEIDETSRPEFTKF